MLDTGRVKSAELSLRAMRECKDKNGDRLWWDQEHRAEPTGKEGVHQQREVLDTGRVKSAELSPRAKRECINKERCLTLVGSKVQS